MDIFGPSIFQVCREKIVIEKSMFKISYKKVYFSILRRYNMITSPTRFKRFSSINSMHNVLHIYVCFTVMLSLGEKKHHLELKLKEHSKSHLILWCLSLIKKRSISVHVGVCVSPSRSELYYHKTSNSSHGFN